jgi:hypothetical protein
MSLGRISRLFPAQNASQGGFATGVTAPGDRIDRHPVYLLLAMLAFDAAAVAWPVFISKGSAFLCSLAWL